MIVYDIEIKKAIEQHTARIAGVEYCEGWRDFANMGIAVICAYDTEDHRSHVFLDDNLGDFHRLVADADTVVGFNNWQFDDPLCAANDITVPKDRSYDLLAEIWRGAGLPTTYEGLSHNGLGLNDCACANLGEGKTGHGAMAPLDWQQGKHGQVINYCLNDVHLTWELVDVVMRRGALVDPRNTDRMITVQTPARFLADGSLR